jgi:hypothetical protein
VERKNALVRFTITSPTVGQVLFEALTEEGGQGSQEVQFRIKLKEDD